MVLFNYSTRELTAKIVYYGPGLCGKTTNLQYIFDNLPGSVKGKMLSLATKTDRTLFFDFLPLDLGEIRGMKTRIQLYTVPGQVFYNETRRLVLKGADGVVFVADSQKQMVEANIDSYRNLEENLRVHSMRLSEMPLVLQFNKRDLPSLSSIDELNAAINRFGSPFYESVATTGIGVQDTLKAVTKLVLLHLTKKYDQRKVASESAAVGGFVGAASLSGSPASAGMGGGSSRAQVVAAPPPIEISSRAPASVPATAYREAIETEEDEEPILELTEEYAEDRPVEVAEPEEEVPIELVEEIEETPVLTEEAETAAEREFEIDHSVDVDEPVISAKGSVEPYATQVSAPAHSGELSPAPRAAGPAAPRPAPAIALGEERQIDVPIEVEIDGRTRRYTLTVRVRLSESDPLQ